MMNVLNDECLQRTGDGTTFTFLNDIMVRLVKRLRLRLLQRLICGKSSSGMYYRLLV